MHDLCAQKGNSKELKDEGFLKEIKFKGSEFVVTFYYPGINASPRVTKEAPRNPEVKL